MVLLFISGLLRDEKGTYDLSFYSGGASMLCAAAIMFTTAACVRCRSIKNGNRKRPPKLKNYKAYIQKVYQFTSIPQFSVLQTDMLRLFPFSTFIHVCIKDFMLHSSEYWYYPFSQIVFSSLSNYEFGVHSWKCYSFAYLMRYLFITASSIC